MTLLSDSPATKGDIAELRDEMRTHFATKADVADLKADLIKWMVGLMLGGIAIAAAVASAIARLI